MISKELFNKVGYFRSEYNGAQDYDWLLRSAEKASLITHIKKLLYHWRVYDQSSSSGDTSSKPYAVESGRQALCSHLKRIGDFSSTVINDPLCPFHYKVISDNAS